jgi:hypothetical protein
MTLQSDLAATVPGSPPQGNRSVIPVAEAAKPLDDLHIVLTSLWQRTYAYESRSKCTALLATSNVDEVLQCTARRRPIATETNAPAQLPRV